MAILEVVKIIDGDTKNHDYDYSAFHTYNYKTGGVMFSDINTKPEFELFDAGSGVIKARAGSAGVLVTQPDSKPIANKEWVLLYELSEEKTLDVTGDKFVFIEIDPQKLLEDGLNNTSCEGYNIGELKSEASLPTHTNFIPLRQITGGDWANAVDQRNTLQIDGSNVDLANYQGDLNANNITANTVTANNVVLPEGDVQDQLDNLESQIESWAVLRTVTAGEDITAWDGQWAVFLANGNILNTTRINQDTTSTNFNFWDNVARERIGFIFTTPSYSWDFLKSIIFQIQKVWNPTDTIQFDLFESDKTTPVAWFTQQTITGLTVNITYDPYVIDLQNVSVNPNTEYFLQVSRTVPGDLANYFQFQWATDLIDLYGSSTFEGSVWTDSDDDFTFDLQYSLPTVSWRAYLTDGRFEGTNNCDGVAIVSGLSWEEIQIQESGDLVNNSVSIWENYYASPKQGILDAQSRVSDDEIQFTNDNVLWAGNEQILSFTPSTRVVLKSILFSRNLTFNVPGTLNLDCRIYDDNSWEPWTELHLDEINFSWTNNDANVPQFIFFVDSKIVLEKGVKYWIGVWGTSSLGSWRFPLIKINSTVTNPNNEYWFRPNSWWPFTLDNTKSLWFDISVFDPEITGENTEQTEKYYIDNIPWQYITNPLPEYSYGSPYYFGNSNQENTITVFTQNERKDTEDNKFYPYYDPETTQRENLNGTNTGLVNFKNLRLSSPSVGDGETIVETFIDRDYLVNVSAFARCNGVAGDFANIRLEYSKDQVNYKEIFFVRAVNTTSTQSAQASFLFNTWYYRIRLTREDGTGWFEVVGVPSIYN